MLIVQHRFQRIRDRVVFADQQKGHVDSGFSRAIEILELRTGQPLRVELKSASDKVKVRGQAAIVLPKDAASKGAPTPKDMLRTATEYSDPFTLCTAAC